jgi:hypothetical protein
VKENSNHFYLFLGDDKKKKVVQLILVHQNFYHAFLVHCFEIPQQQLHSLLLMS